MAATLAGYGLFAAGWLDRLDQFGMELHIRHFSSIPADPRIVMIDIDDQSLRAAPWPWPRRIMAELVRTLHELGAKTIVLDIVYSEPADPRHEHRSLKDKDIDPGLPRFGDLARDPIVYDDRELAAAIRDAGNVYLSMFFEMTGPDDPWAGRDEEIAQRFLEKPTISFTEFASTYEIEPKPVSQRVYNLFRFAAPLELNFGADASTLAATLGLDAELGPRDVEAHLASAKRKAARQLAGRFIKNFPKGNFREFFASALPTGDCDALTADRAALVEAYRWALAQRAVVSKSSLPLSDSERVAYAQEGTFPLVSLVESAKGVGMVSFLRSSDSGVIRSIPLIARSENRAFLQLGLLAAFDPDDPAALQLDTLAGPLRIRGDRNERRLPLDRSSATPIHWHVPASCAWPDSFVHIPAARVIEVIDLRNSIHDNETRAGLHWAELLALRHQETHTELARFEQAVAEHEKIRQDVRTIPSNEREPLRGELQKLGEQIDAMRAEAAVWLERIWTEWRKTSPRTPDERREFDQIQRLCERIIKGNLNQSVITRNGLLQERIQARLAELKPIIEGKICFVGYTASAVADLVHVPPYAAVPGVMVHANVCNMVLQNRPLIPAASWANAVLVLAVGLLMTLVTATRNPPVSASFLLTICVALFALGGTLFWKADVVLSSLFAATIAGVVWAAVTACRQLTEERARRGFERALRQYTSYAVAARIAENFDASALAPQLTTVTCFYADLMGFTPLSERLGPEKTRLVLNPYLELLTRVLTQHTALVNKFMGDGVFAFFNAPILSCPIHAEAACRAAHDARVGLAEINRKLALMPGHEPLRMRIGLATGPVFVGDFGNDTKLDYTCIGDAVNLGARLEAAGKKLGCGTLLDASTRLGAAEAFRFRALGRFLVAGRSEPVQIFELCGLDGPVDLREQSFLAGFEQAVSAFQDGRWEECRKALIGCKVLRTNDLPTLLYWEELLKRESLGSSDKPGPIALG